MTNLMPAQSRFRPKVARLVRRLLSPFVEEGVVTNAEWTGVVRNLEALAKTGELAPAIPPRLLKAEEVAELLGISLSAFKHAEAAGEISIPRRTVGKGAVRYLNANVFAYMAQTDGGEETEHTHMPSK